MRQPCTSIFFLEFAVTGIPRLKLTITKNHSFTTVHCTSLHSRHCKHCTHTKEPKNLVRGNWTEVCVSHPSRPSPNVSCQRCAPLCKRGAPLLYTNFPYPPARSAGVGPGRAGRGWGAPPPTRRRRRRAHLLCTPFINSQGRELSLNQTLA